MTAGRYISDSNMRPSLGAQGHRPRMGEGRLGEMYRRTRSLWGGEGYANENGADSWSCTIKEYR